MTLRQSMLLVRRAYPKARLMKWNKGRYLVVNDVGLWLRLGNEPGYCRAEKAWKMAAWKVRKSNTKGD